MSFVVMVMFAIIDAVTGWMGKTFVIHEYIYESFKILTLGSFGIGVVNRGITRTTSPFTKKKSNKGENTQEIEGSNRWEDQ